MVIFNRQHTTLMSDMFWFAKQICSAAEHFCIYTVNLAAFVKGSDVLKPAFATYCNRCFLYRCHEPGSMSCKFTSNMEFREHSGFGHHKEQINANGILAHENYCMTVLCMTGTEQSKIFFLFLCTSSHRLFCCSRLIFSPNNLNHMNAKTAYIGIYSLSLINP